ncbi:hypothetical protein ACHQM5_008184 [Ranunculus cassubicifolius]
MKNIQKLVSNGLYQEAISLYTQFHKTKSFSNNFLYPPLFKACGKLKSSPQGQSLHAIVIKIGFHNQLCTATSLADMYMKLRCSKDAYKVFDEMPERNIVSFNTTISGLSQSGDFVEAFFGFKNVCLSEFRANSVTVASLLSGCKIVGCGLQVHGFAIKLGVEMDVYVATTLLTMYSNCGEVVSALRVFERIPHMNVVSYNALMTVLLQNGMAHRVLDLYKVMRETLDEEATYVTWISVLSASSVAVDIQFGMQVHCLILKYKLDYDVMIGTALVDMYCKCGCWKSADKVFEEMEGCRNLFTWNSMMSGMLLNGECDKAVHLFEQLESEGLVPDSISWNSMISGFSQLGKGAEAFYFFKKMQLAGVTPTLKSVTSLLPACAVLFSLQRGKEIHGYTIRTGIQSDEFITTSLIDMYMKCGISTLARRVFDHFDRRSDDPAIWNAMISGYGRNGENDNVLRIFELMKEEGVHPNSATLTSILSACSHTGKVEKGLEIFKMVTKDYGLIPTSEHFGCVVDLLGRAGRLQDAWDLIQEIPNPLTSFYLSLLGACRSHVEADLGEEICERLSDLEPKDPTPLVIMSNIYAAQGKWSDAERIREMMRTEGIMKHHGYSLIGDVERGVCS